MLCGVGVDLVERSRMVAAYRRWPERLAARICNKHELTIIQGHRDPPGRLAVAFGLKEAVMKALGTGMRGVGWKDIDTTADPEGHVERLLTGRGLIQARRLGVRRYAFSFTYSRDIVIATVILNGGDVEKSLLREH